MWQNKETWIIIFDLTFLFVYFQDDTQNIAGLASPVKRTQLQVHKAKQTVVWYTCDLINKLSYIPMCIDDEV